MENITHQNTHVLKMGTRGSLLALTQSHQVCQQLTALTKTKVEVVEVTTSGDQDTSKPLWQLEGHDFFTKELDRALLEKKVDFVVHSYKDLGSRRPVGVELAAITKREYAHDILLIKKTLIQDLRKGSIRKFILGTSSPRRMAQCRKNLAKFLPHPNREGLEVEISFLRGNVNSRIQKLKDDQYHGIVLAMAGLERLACSDQSRLVLKSLLTDIDFAILPLSYFPTAAAQGALALECRSDDEQTKNFLKVLHHESSAKLISRERELFQNYGGGCHLPIGIQTDEVLGQQRTIIRGETPQDHKWIEKTIFPDLGNGDDKANLVQAFKKVKLSTTQECFLGMKSHKDDFYYDICSNPSPCDLSKDILIRLQQSSHLFVSSQYCFTALEKLHHYPKISVAGPYTWKKLSQQNTWVHFSAEGLGDDQLKALAESRLLADVFEVASPIYLTHNQVSQRDQKELYQFPTLAVYNRSFKKDHLQNDEKHYLEKLFHHCKIYYWSSYGQYLHYQELFKQFCPQRQSQWDQAIHCCGVGKTFLQLQKQVPTNNLFPMLSPKHFKQLVTTYLQERNYDD